MFAELVVELAKAVETGSELFGAEFLPHVQPEKQFIRSSKTGEQVKLEKIFSSNLFPNFYLSLLESSYSSASGN